MGWRAATREVHSPIAMMADETMSIGECGPAELQGQVRYIRDSPRVAVLASCRPA